MGARVVPPDLLPNERSGGRLRPFALLTLLLSLATTANAQSITSFEPDTTSRAKRERDRAEFVEIPVWTGFEIAPVPGYTSELDGNPSRASMPWLGMTAAWPWKGPQEGWLGVGLQHWDFGAVAFDQYTIRSGVDELFWASHRVSLAIGGGIGFGMGWESSDLVLSFDAIARGMLRFNVTQSARLSLGVVGGGMRAEGSYIDEQVIRFGHAEFIARIDHTTKVPKRIVPGL